MFKGGGGGGGVHAAVYSTELFLFTVQLGFSELCCFVLCQLDYFKHAFL